MNVKVAACQSQEQSRAQVFSKGFEFEFMEWSGATEGGDGVKRRSTNMDGKGNVV